MKNCSAKWRQRDWMVKNLEEKYATAQRLAEKRIKGKTFVFTWRLGIGEKLAKVLDVPFIQHKTKNALRVIDENDTMVVSSVADEGLSAAVDRIIEVDFQFGGRAQLFQRYLRAAHDTGRRSEFHSIVTEDEYAKYAKRYLIFEYHGLDIEMHGVGERGASSVERVAPRRVLNVSKGVRVKAVAKAQRQTRASKEPHEAEVVLKNPAVRTALVEVEKTLTARAVERKWLDAILKLLWDKPLTIAMMKEVKGASVLSDWQSIIKTLSAKGFLVEWRAGFMTNKEKLYAIQKGAK